MGWSSASLGASWLSEKRTRELCLLLSAERRKATWALYMYVAPKRARPRARPEASALAPDLRRARCTPLELRHVRT